MSEITINTEYLKEVLDPLDYAIVRRITNPYGPRKDQLRNQKPPVTAGDLLSREASYVWRAVRYILTQEGDPPKAPKSIVYKAYLDTLITTIVTTAQ